MPKPPTDIHDEWFAQAHESGRCAICGKTGVLEAHHIKRRELRVAWMPENAILLCRDHHRLAHNDKTMFMLALKGAAPDKWQFQQDHGNDSPTWDDVRARLKEKS